MELPEAHREERSKLVVVAPLEEPELRALDRPPARAMEIFHRGRYAEQRRLRRFLSVAGAHQLVVSHRPPQVRMGGDHDADLVRVRDRVQEIDAEARKPPFCVCGIGDGDERIPESTPEQRVQPCSVNNVIDDAWPDEKSDSRRPVRNVSELGHTQTIRPDDAA